MAAGADGALLGAPATRFRYRLTGRTVKPPGSGRPALCVASGLDCSPLRANRDPQEVAMTIHFVVHEEGDSVGTIVVEGVTAGAALTGWIMEQDKTVTIETLDDIPIGHKIALKELKNGDTVIKYGVDIGRTIAPIRRGGYLHVHNVKTKRW